ncbi:cytochrome P450 [Dactylosporangium sp. NPDC005572]|uniref:cytochrome P450 n=1 Tax=Dactylosporangium sp. NPDC005572 TaxID=3156889 RepID=UPI0033AD728B
MLSGEVPQLLDPKVEVDPYAFYRRLRNVDPLHHDESTGALLITRHADVLAAYRNPAVTTANYAWQLEPVMGRTLLQLDGAEHARIRGILTPHFRGHGLDGWVPSIERNVAAIVDGAVENATHRLARCWSPGDEVDVVTAFARYLPVYVIADMLGLPHEDHARFYSWYSAQSAFLSNLGGDPAVERRGVEALVELREYLLPLVQQRRRGDGDDLISVLARAETPSGPLDDVEVMTHVTHLLNAGSETTDRTIANLLHHLLRDRRWWEATRLDSGMVSAAISETLRLTPPSQLNGRVTSAVVDLPSGTIPADTFVILVMASANRDERRYSQPDVFNPAREDVDHARAFTSTGEHFAFGHGRHFCLGALVARAELTCSLRILQERFPAMRLADGFVVRDRGIKMRSPAELRVVL